MITVKKIEEKFVEYLGGREKVEEMVAFYANAGHSKEKALALLSSRLPTKQYYRLMQLNGQLHPLERGEWIVEYPPLGLREQLRKDSFRSPEARKAFVHMMRPYRKGEA